MSTLPIEPTDVINRSNFDLSALNQTLEEIKNLSFYSLYDKQRMLTGSTRFDVPLTQLQYRKERKGNETHDHYQLQLNYAFVIPRKRFEYKKSKLYKKELTLLDIATNYRLFNRTCMVFIDGKFIDGIRVTPREDVTLILFDIEKLNRSGFSADYIQSLIQNGTQATILFVPNGAYGVYQTSPDTLRLYEDHLHLKDLGLSGHLNSETEYITFIDNHPELFFNAHLSQSDIEENLTKFNPLYDEDNHEPVHLNVFGFSHLKEMRYIGPDRSYIQITDCQMPVPTENILLFRKDDYGHLTFAHDLQLKMYYSNTYEIIGKKETDEVVAFIFYADNIIDDDTYRDELRLYRILSDLSVTRYEENRVLDIVKQYDEERIEYNFPDYFSSNFVDDSLKYKLDKLGKLIKQHPNYLSIYLNHIHRDVDGYYIDMSTVDYEGKKRMDNHDVASDDKLVTFQDERILIILRNDKGNREAFRFFIDGLIYKPTDKWRMGIYDHYYIPSSILLPTSILEVEHFPVFEVKREFSAPDTMLNNIEITLDTEYEFFINDINIVDNVTKRYLKYGEDYHVTIQLKDGTMSPPFPEDSFYPVHNGTFYVHITNQALSDKSLTTFVARKDKLSQYNINNNFAVNDVFRTISPSFPDKRHYRIFRNGKLIPQDFYVFLPTHKYNEPSVIDPAVLKIKGDIFTLDYTPHRYKVVYNEQLIPGDGFVDLKGRISKPLDFKWYDFFLNGRKLSKRQVSICTPTVMVIHNVFSLNNLIIVERDQDPDFLSIEDADSTIIDKLLELDEEFRNKAVQFTVNDDGTLEENSPIDPTEPDIITEILQLEDIELNGLVNGILYRFNFINPNLDLLTQEDYDDYQKFFYNRDILMLNPNNTSDVNTRIIVTLGFQMDYEEDVEEL